MILEDCGRWPHFDIQDLFLIVGRTHLHPRRNLDPMACTQINIYIENLEKIVNSVNILLFTSQFDGQ